MNKIKIPDEWDLGATRRYKRQNMDSAMRGKIERGLVELITNSDDSYRELEENTKQISGKMRIEIGRRKKGQTSNVIVKDRATGMNKEEMYQKLGALGERTSGFEKRKMRRGLNGRGARDIAAFGIVHFESIKDEEYNHLIIPLSLKCHFTEPYPKKVTQEIRKKLGIPRGNGTKVTIEVDSRFKIPLHERLIKDFSRYYSLRDIFSNPKREILIVDINKNRKDHFFYNYPIGEILFDEDLLITEYPDAKAHLIIRKHSTPFEQKMLPYREGGILVKSAVAIHDCTYFGLESESFSWNFTGELYCEFIDKLICEYDDREEINPDNPNHPVNNPMRLLSPSRDGFLLEHPFAQILYKKGKDILQPFIEKLKTSKESQKRDVTSENLDKKLNNLSKEISKLFEKKIKELEDTILPGAINIGINETLSIGLHIIPSSNEQPIPVEVNQVKTFSIKIKHYEALDELLPIVIDNSNPENIKIVKSSTYLERFSEDKKIGMATFALKSSKIGAEALIEVSYSGYADLLYLKVVEPPPPAELPEGLSFEKPLYHLKINKEKLLILYLRTDKKVSNRIIADTTSNHPEIVIKGGEKCILNRTNIPEILKGKIRVQGRQLKVKGEITARAEGFPPVETTLVVEEHLLTSGVQFKFEPVEENFGSVRYKWENPYFLKIGAEHFSIRKYLGNLTEEGKYQGIDNPLYHAVLADVIAEALAFNILEKTFKKEGQEGMLDYASADLYYHREFSEFLIISHKHLV